MASNINHRRPAHTWQAHTWQAYPLRTRDLFRISPARLSYHLPENLFVYLMQLDLLFCFSFLNKRGLLKHNKTQPHMFLKNVFVVAEKFTMIPFLQFHTSQLHSLSDDTPAPPVLRGCCACLLRKLNSRLLSLAFRTLPQMAPDTKFLFQLLHSNQINLPGGQACSSSWNPALGFSFIVYLLPQRRCPSILPIEILPTIFLRLCLHSIIQESFSLSPPLGSGKKISRSAHHAPDVLVGALSVSHLVFIAYLGDFFF